jgi:hypothetical protein
MQDFAANVGPCFRFVLVRDREQSVGGDPDDRHLMRTVRCWRRQLDEVDVSKAVDLGLVIMSAEYQDDVGIAQRIDEFVAIGDGVEAEVQGHDDRRALGQLGQIIAQERDRLGANRLSRVIQALVVPSPLTATC